jgi:DNA modification methylase
MTFSNYTELWTLDKKDFADHLDVWYEKRDNTAKYIHPTQKPVALAERAVKRSSAKGDAVLDAFGGSGSTLIACEQLKRKARLIELDPKYVDAIVLRWESFTHEKAKKL